MTMIEASKPQRSALSQNSTLIIAVIAVVAVVVAVVAVLLLNNRPTTSTESYADIPHSRTSDGGFVLGDPEAPLTVIEFADFACPHCQDYHPTITQFIEENVRTGKAKFEYRMFISGADPVWGEYTAKLAECAAEQQDGGFWPAHSVLFEIGSRGRFNEQTARTLSDRLGLNYAELLNCAGEADQVNTDVQLGTSLGVASTPTIMVRLGDAAPQFITVNGGTYNRGPVPYDVLQGVVNNNQ
jgi:protein-disulfide isomerase